MKDTDNSSEGHPELQRNFSTWYATDIYTASLIVVLIH